jgi:hypothetical protein
VPDFQYPGVLIDEIVRSRKDCSVPLDAVLRRLKDGTLRESIVSDYDMPVILEWIIKAGDLSNPETFRSSLLVNAIRVRGIDFHPFSQRYHYKEICPAGWHQDFIYPKERDKRKQSIALDPLTDLRDFVLRVAAEWNIDVKAEEELL